MRFSVAGGTIRADQRIHIVVDDQRKATSVDRVNGLTLRTGFGIKRATSWLTC
jgi:hypothetical protein